MNSIRFYRIHLGNVKISYKYNYYGILLCYEIYKSVIYNRIQTYTTIVNCWKGLVDRERKQ